MRNTETISGTQRSNTEHLASYPVPQEYCAECPDRSRVVVRDTALRDNSMLPAAFQRTAGDLLYDGLRNGLVVDGQV